MIRIIVNTICRIWRDVTVEKGIVNDRKVKIVTCVVTFSCQGTIKVIFEVKVKVGSRIRRSCCIFDHVFHCIY